jgi:hypothetical protein
MAGLINTGIGYKNRALSGMVRQSAEEKRIEEANKELDAAEKNQTATMTISGAASGAMIGAQMGGASYGPAGAVAGAALGFLFSRLF